MQKNIIEKCVVPMGLTHFLVECPPTNKLVGYDISHGYAIFVAFFVYTALILFFEY
jgi:hypothetical protein